MEELKRLDKDIVDADDINEADLPSSITNSSNSAEEGSRGTWGGRFDFLLTIVGYTVGFGNIWRFPFLCYKNGGGAFLIPFLIFLILCGGPLYYMEALLGQFSGKSPIQVWQFCPLAKGMGFLMVFASTIVLWYQAQIFSWVLYYLVNSFHTQLPWATCNHWWNTPNCRDFTKAAEQNLSNSVGNHSTWNTNVSENRNVSETNATVSSIKINLTNPADEFWLHNVLHKSDGIDNLGPVQLHLALCLLAVWLVTFMCIFKGVKSIGKVVYFTVTMPYVMLTVLLIRGLTLKGSVNGIILYLTPDFSKLLKLQVWLEAAAQVFFSLGPAWGGVVTLASFNKFHHQCLRDTVLVCIADGFTAFYSGFVVFSILGFMSAESGLPLTEVASSGPGLAFVTYPAAITRLPLPQLWSVLFFIMLALVGIDSQFGLVETLSNAVFDLFSERIYKYRVHINACVCALCFIFGLPLTTRGGIYIFQVIDWYIGAFCILFGSVVECVAVGWIYGADRFSKDVEMMLGRRLSILTHLSWCLISPIFLLTTFVLSLMKYKEPDYNDGYIFPTYAIALGNIIAILPVIVVILCPLCEIFFIRKGTLKQRLHAMVIPSRHWIPNDIKQREIYLQNPYRHQRFSNRILLILFGNIANKIHV